MLRRVMFCFAVLIASVVFGGFAANEVYIASVGRGAGAGGSQFYTTVWLTNLSSTNTINFTFSFLKDGQSNLGGIPAFADSLAPGQTRMYEDVIENTLGISNEFGAARITANGDIFVSARVYNQANPSDNLGTTEGLFFSAVPKSFSIGLGESASLQGVNQGNSSENMRSNFDLVETTGHTCTVHIALLDASGASQGTTDVPMLAYGHVKLNANSLESSINTVNDRIVATVTAGPGNVILAGEQLANTSQDSSGFEMSFKDTLLGGSGVTSLNGLTGDLTIAHGANTTVNVSGHTITIDAVSGSGSGLTAVAHDTTLAGSGTVGVPLGVASPLDLTSNSTSNSGLVSEMTNTGGGGFVAAIAGLNDSTSGNGIGVVGSQAGSGWGVYGTTQDGIGVYGTSASGVGVFGKSASGTFTTPPGTVGVWGDNPSGVGVFGSSTSTTQYDWYGVLGEGVVGVEGYGTTVGILGGQNISYGVGGYATQVGDVRVGVFGVASGGTTNLAGEFFGDVDVMGNLSKTSGSFKIDDPIDPANKYLYHSFVESPDMKNVYDGIATFDEHGVAAVDLPRFYSALNRDSRYQLTALGTPQPGLFIAQEVADNRFVIAGGVPGARVSWQITGIRQDAWANAHRIPVEIDKSPAEKGTYLTPIEEGQPREKGLSYLRDVRAKVQEKTPKN
jgi:hypothetical protein